MFYKWSNETFLFNTKYEEIFIQLCSVCAQYLFESNLVNCICENDIAQLCTVLFPLQCSIDHSIDPKEYVLLNTFKHGRGLFKKLFVECKNMNIEYTKQALCIKKKWNIECINLK